MSGPTFSESWYRVASLRVSLRPTVRVQRQVFRGEDWYVLHDPFNNSFFRIRPPAYAFLAQLSIAHTVDEAWQRVLNQAGDDAPGQDEAIRLLAQLYQSNLLYTDGQPDADRLFERYRKRTRRELASKLIGFLYTRIPLWDPEHFLRRLQPLTRLLVSPWGFAGWLVMVVLGLKAVVDNAGQLATQSSGLLSPGNLIWLYVAMAMLKLIHEMGHALVCKRYGGEVHTMGVMLIALAPLPYMDASSSWAFRSHGQRALVGLAGMAAEMLTASVAALVWASTGAGVVHSVAFNVMVVASVSTVLFNGNPLMRFDAYYVMCDLIQVPNLFERARKQWVYWIERFAFGTPMAVDPSGSRGEAAWLGAYGFGSTLNRLFVTFGITLYIADQFFILGVLTAAISLVMLVVLPLGRLPGYLLSCPRIERRRLRATLLSGGALAAVVVGLAFVPVPDAITAPGVVEASAYEQVNAPEAGHVRSLAWESSQWVEAGTVLAVLQNPELDLDIAEMEAEIRGAKAMLAAATQRSMADMAPIQARLTALEQRLAELEQRRARMTVRAERAGLWVATPEIQRQLCGCTGFANREGAWIRRGKPLGVMLDPKAYRFVAVVSQDQAAHLFSDDIGPGVVRLWGRGGEELTARTMKVIPYERRELPSAALGWWGGGTIAVSQRMDSATEAFFEVNLELEPGVLPPVGHGRSGLARFELPPQPLAAQAGRYLTQLMQARYRL